MALVIDACFAQHQGDRTEQQDRVAILAHPRARGVALAVVADGMGGHTGGALAAEQVVHTARNSLAHYSPTEEVPVEMLKNSMSEAHTMIKASRFINEKDPHSTAVLMLLQPGKVVWAYCGDSRLYHFRGEKLQTRTLDHSYVERLIAAGKITLEQAATHPQRNMLLTSLGGGDEPTYSAGESRPQAGDSYLLCSDGLWGYFDDAELGQVIAGSSARQACETLIARARERAAGAGDNCSLVVLKLAEPVQEKPKPPSGFKARGDGGFPALNLE